ncbi:DUF2017 domain-containing protein [Streptomyces clavuligerus]|uniref:DUF2017 domain-containing protein n=1 Tax=Streptomyces clavuligerus TaxID=1901 RepID=E2Q560_STRCL|nr:DUF2017 domain-containing protein [Streptomyces clavuligerus]ANW20009.1 hypothetical protein BB341_18180 [Streptomyces clavuligerus]AXU14636.1 DUF2017 domain-containing protein [Streptomyces clavuligerus]EFG07101.1 DUF2017 domain-containing protein [Streptomyces clavuligerus]MBY6304649.1 DUF2017 domain-containing protein [Streptomyces clavuligerus]QCS07407.1 DUF2017 domain-containing protein [Streptomyces clavuligerus]
MPGHFEPVPGGGAAVALDDVEVSILRSLAVQLLELIGPGDTPVEGEDPLAALFAEGPSEPPSDPALARLFPDAYAGPGADGSGSGTQEASAEFRRFTENDLRTHKREDALAVVRTLDSLAPAAEGGAVLKLSPEDCVRWLRALNDLRLTIGTRLEVTDEDESSALYRLPDSDPRKPMVMAYLWLGVLQETLVETLLP